MYQFNRGDERAFKKLFDSFFGASCAFVKHYIPEHEAVEDVVQETFKAYLYKSLRNNALFYLRQHRVNEEVDPRLEDNTESVLNVMIEEEVHREIIAAISKLPKERRRVVELSMAGFSQEEIAEKMAISVNTVKTQKRKAYAFLREELKHLFIIFLVLMNM